MNYKAVSIAILNSLFISIAQASELGTRIIKPLPVLTKYSDAAAACESVGMELATFARDGLNGYPASILMENNIDRAWIAEITEGKAKPMALEVMNKVPIEYKIAEVKDSEKMLAVLCQTKAGDEPAVAFDESKELILETEENSESNDYDDAPGEQDEAVICEFEVAKDGAVEIVHDIQQDETEGAIDVNLDKILIRGSGYRYGHYRRDKRPKRHRKGKGRCSRRRCSSSSDSSSSDCSSSSSSFCSRSGMSSSSSSKSSSSSSSSSDPGCCQLKRRGRYFREIRISK